MKPEKEQGYVPYLYLNEIFIPRKVCNLDGTVETVSKLFPTEINLK